MAQVSPPVSPERSKSPEEIKAAEIVSACGARPLGTQRGLGITPDLFLFVDAHGSTVGVPLVGISTATVREKLLESDRRWNGETACAGEQSLEKERV
jgi:hypothetical protein